MTDPYYRDQRSQIFCGDSRALLAEMKPHTFHACITDPPYELSDSDKASPARIFLEVMFPQKSEFNAQGSGEDQLPFLVDKVLGLDIVGVIPTPPSTVPVSAMTLNGDPSRGYEDIKAGGESSVIVSDAYGSQNIEPQSPEYLGCFALKFTDMGAILDALDSAGCSFLSGNLGVGMRIGTPGFPGLKCSSVVVDDRDSVIGLRDRAFANLVGAFVGAAHDSVASLSMSGSSSESLSTHRAIVLLAVLLCGSSELIRAVPAAGRFSSVLKPRRISIVSDVTGRTLTFDLLSHDASLVGKGFMGKEWDGTKIAFDPSFWREVFRVLKPGAYLGSFGGSRTVHRIACAIEDAGFEIIDTALYLYGTGFPKGADISKAFDKKAGVTRDDRVTADPANNKIFAAGTIAVLNAGAPVTDLAKEWEGYNTQLKPSYEPIVIARKPFKGTVIQNLVTNGTGAMNIEAARPDGPPRQRMVLLENSPARFKNDTDQNYGFKGTLVSMGETTKGRYPANIVLGCDCDGEHDLNNCPLPLLDRWEGISSLSRFFYTAKASTKERERGLENFEAVRRTDGRKAEANVPGLRTTARKNFHATVKPLDLMEWLVRLLTPRNGLILDPFLGSGTTRLAALNQGFRCVGVELDEDHCKIAAARKS